MHSKQGDIVSECWHRLRAETAI